MVRPGRGGEGNVRVEGVDGTSVGTGDVPCAISGDGRGVDSGLELQATMMTTATTIRGPRMYTFSLTPRRQGTSNHSARCLSFIILYLGIPGNTWDPSKHHPSLSPRTRSFTERPCEPVLYMLVTSKCRDQEQPFPYPIYLGYNVNVNNPSHRKEWGLQTQGARHSLKISYTDSWLSQCLPVPGTRLPQPPSLLLLRLQASPQGERYPKRSSSRPILVEVCRFPLVPVGNSG